MTVSIATTPVFALWFCLLASAPHLTAADLTPDTIKAFDEYIRLKEAQLRDQLASGDFLWADRAPERKQQLHDGKILIRPPGDKPDLDVPDGVIHDWLGAAFIPDTTVDRTISMVQDYDNHSRVYQPEVIGSKILVHHGDDFRIFLRLKKKKVITVVLNTEHDVHYSRLDDKRWETRSYSTHIAEVESAGPTRRARAAGWKRSRISVATLLVLAFSGERRWSVRRVRGGFSNTHRPGGPRLAD